MSIVQIPWTSADLELLPDSPNRYEIIDGELYMTRAPHWQHQKTISKITIALGVWSEQTQSGTVVINPGLVFRDTDNVIPDLVWISQEKLNNCMDEAGHLTDAPELVIEVLSNTPADVRRDRESKLKLYSNQGVREYWIVDWRLEKIEIYRRDRGKLQLIETLMDDDEITSDILLGFSCRINSFFI
ncbi:Uma2 family endonuclease [Roseofilum casamattae]|uniref:Uma2 family endonuclease n=1 Tax=Roseofilum casamattae BLCC-M143 TaxID=3022442 RepID=A0ABT7BSH8_9CYAN|nr:Uma2 family endonuclease [Roseofilum casamattae]MDJ1182147.1 Uma2 family endonuclease [Roseofilum casamattae BLCC-M143]